MWKVVKMEKKDVIVVIYLLFISLYIRAFNLSNVCMYGDEWLYWLKTNKILANNFLPTADVFDYSPPFLSYIEAVIALLFEGDLSNFRMISVIFGSLTVPFLYLFGKEMYDRKTGFLSALFLCFSAYHCLYSRTIMLEALTLFFITSFLYFFWLSEKENGAEKRIKYACVAGTMMGLAFDAKYISFFLIPAIPLYILWTRRFQFKALVEKRMILIAIFAFLLFLPLLICLFYTGVGFHGVFYYADEKFEKESIATNRVWSFSLGDLLMRGSQKIGEVLAWGVSIFSPYIMSYVVLLFFLTIISYLPGFLRGERKSSFLIIPLFILCLFVLGSARHRHYLIYILPFYFVMLSNFILNSFKNLGKGGFLLNFFRIISILLAAILLFSSFISAFTSPYWDKGEYSWICNVVNYIKRDIKDGNACYCSKDKVIIGTFTSLKEPVDYYIDFNASIIRVYKAPESIYEGKREEVSVEKIERWKPRYLITSDARYEYYIKGEVEKKIFENYTMTFRSQTYPSAGLVLKRNNRQEISNLREGEGGVLCREIFEKSIPEVMKVGKVYTGIVKVKNEGDSYNNFTISMHSNEFIIFIENGFREIALNKGSTCILKFKIVPLKEHIGKIPIIIDVYVKKKEKMYKVDSFTDYVLIS